MCDKERSAWRQAGFDEGYKKGRSDEFDLQQRVGQKVKAEMIEAGAKATADFVGESDWKVFTACTEAVLVAAAHLK